jgi:antitoxin component of MazEF toxin-antitoxin module
VIQCYYYVDTQEGGKVIKKLTKHGNSLALVIERPVLELLKIDSDTPLDITTDGSVLVISPVRDAKRRKEFEKALEKANRKYGRMLKKLAE